MNTTTQLTSHQTAVIKELREMRLCGMLGIITMNNAIDIVVANRNSTFSESNCMRVADAADMAIDLARAS
jgi:hypothetical protein